MALKFFEKKEGDEMGSILNAKEGVWIRLVESILKSGFRLSCYQSDKDTLSVIATRNGGEAISTTGNRLMGVLRQTYCRIFIRSIKNTEDNDVMKGIERWLDGTGRSIDMYWLKGSFCIEIREIIELSKDDSKKIQASCTRIGLARKLFYFQNSKIRNWPRVCLSKSKTSIFDAINGLQECKPKYESPKVLLSSC